MYNSYYNPQYRQTLSTSNNSMSAPDSYIDDNFFMNLGHRGEFHMSFPDSEKERDKVFYGTIYEATADHIVIYDDASNEWYLLPLLYLNYATTKEKPIKLNKR